MTKRTPTAPANVLVLQGGGALGAYQAGAAVALAEHGHAPDWIAGISIGAINAAIIAGNPAGMRKERLLAFWEGCGQGLGAGPLWGGDTFRRAYGEWAASVVAMRGVPGFFTPRFPQPQFRTAGTPEAISYYDTRPLRDTLAKLVDFDWLNDKGPRLSLGAVEVETGNFVYFDSTETTITVDHVMASGALPPAFQPVIIDGKAYWDGGVVSNTPLQHVLENAGDTPLCIFQVDLFSARGPMPRDMSEAMSREKDIRYSSRTRLNTDLFRQRIAMAAAAQRLRDRLPPGLQYDPDLTALCDAAPKGAITLMHLIHRKDAFDGAAKDYEFSTMSMRLHWEEGARDVARALAHPDWTARATAPEALRVFDFGHAQSADATLAAE